MTNSGKWYPARYKQIQTNQTVDAYIIGIDSNTGHSSAAWMVLDESGIVLDQNAFVSHGKSDERRGQSAAAYRALEILPYSGSIRFCTDNTGLIGNIVKYSSIDSLLTNSKGRKVSGAEIWSRFIECKRDKALAVHVQFVNPHTEPHKSRFTALRELAARALNEK
ncbi:hypothetical protein [Prosthecodimorpha staleyi]|uniref:RNase H type-1 domain-containing protein n=1 Tax=Prosthecodimorpha staleyi TaxID=2840188 RepID=A0A947D5Z4_9HYPH|nr:hypothetical protein [Prosthecodimorpha staleyi]MBT9288757.1 hypothetical protein [Prosthecodimorpha staleyi]